MACGAYWVYQSTPPTASGSDARPCATIDHDVRAIEIARGYLPRSASSASSSSFTVPAPTPPSGPTPAS